MNHQVLLRRSAGLSLPRLPSVTSRAISGRVSGLRLAHDSSSSSFKSYLSTRGFSNVVGGSADGAQWAVIVQLGAGVPSLFKLSGLMGMDRMSLLEALAESRGFKRSLQDVALDMCVVTVCASANKKRPSEEAMAKAVPLEGGETLGELASGMAAAGTYLFVRVTLPGGDTTTTATTADEAAHGESRAP